MILQENIPLKDKNTFGISSVAKYYVEINNPEDIKELVGSKLLESNKFYILGGGSNTIFPDFYDGVIIKNNIKGKDIIAEDNDSVTYLVGAGEDWNEFVNFVVDKNLSGIEALALIPGSVGAAPVQNIGAYGEEAKNTIVNVHGVNLETGEELIISNEDCKFGYRDSVFKQELKDKVLITKVEFKLSKSFKTDNIYPEVNNNLIIPNEFTIKNIRDTVVAIRNKKLPNPNDIGNAGSIFKNPIVSRELHDTLKQKYPEMPSFEANGMFKIPAAWLIEQRGWKGWVSSNNNYGVYKNHALIIVNFGNATGKELIQLTEDIKKSVFDNFGIELEREVNIAS